MRWVATLLALVVALKGAPATDSNPDYRPGDIWADGLLQSRVISEDDQSDVATATSPASSNGTFVEASIDLMGLASATTFCAVDNQYTLDITISKCLTESEYKVLWDIQKCSISNSKLKRLQFTYKDCSSAVGAPATTSPISGPPRIEVMKGRTTPVVAGAVAIRVCPALNCAVLSTDIVVSQLTLTNKELTMIPASIRNAIDCPTPTGSCSIQEGNEGICKCQCPDISTTVGSQCTCPSKKILVGSICQCPTGSTAQGNGDCKCSNNKIIVGNACQCPTGSSPDTSGNCKCSGGRNLVDGECKCPGDSTFDGSACSCSGGRSLSNGACTCPSDLIFDGSSCKCSGGRDLVSGVCQCSGELEFRDNICQCPSGQVRDGNSNQCRCLNNKIKNGKTCVCDGDLEIDSAGNCGCPAGQNRVGTTNQCTCPTNKVKNGKTCKCDGQLTDTGSGVCGCLPGFVQTGTQCSCPEGMMQSGNTCQCDGDLKSDGNGGCACLAGQERNGNSNQCKCRNNKVKDGEICKCDGDLEIDGAGNCGCPAGQDRVGNSNQCTCRNNKIKNGKNCDCNGDLEIDSAGNCGCPSGHVRDGNSNQCRCLKKKNRVGRECQCPAGATSQGSDDCICSGGRDIVDGECKCPSNYHFKNDKCVPNCYWKANNAGFDCPWNAAKSSFKLADDCGIISPAAKDNYVADKRDNKNDATLDDPVIAISATKKGESPVTHKSTWKDYFLNPTTLENEFAFSTFGVYDLEMIATDYSYSAECSGCVAIVDKFPPTATTKCGTTARHTTTVPYSADSLAYAIDEETKFTAFYSSGNVVNNGALDVSTGANERCDDISATMKDFFAVSASKLNSIDDKCFDNDFVKHLLDESPSASRLSTYSQIELNALQCTRCCSKSRKLKEYYYDYKCGTDVTTLEKKTATSGDECAFEYCLNVPINSLVTASVTLKNAVVTETATVIAGLPTSVSPAINEIHRSITCTSFSEGCSYTPTLGELFNHPTSWAAGNLGSYDVNNYVSWRYTVNTVDWNEWSDSAQLTFTTASSSVFIEAWTHCGLAYRGRFDVILHPHSSHNACAAFSQMWVEKSPPPQADTRARKCTYPGSDFMLLSFEYDSETGATHDAATVKGKYTDVKCYVTLAEGGSLSQVKETELQLESSTTDHIHISKQLALELVHDPTTAENTDVEVRCDFTFAYFNAGGQTKSEPCSDTFTITDCDGPEFKAPGSEVCKIGQCDSPTGTPGPFEACSGSVLTTKLDSTVGASPQLVTQIKSMEAATCCPDCSTTLACAVLPESAATDGVKRCQPTNPETTMVPMQLGVEGEDESKIASLKSSTVLELLAATAMVAVVALVVVKRRATTSTHTASEMDDVYVSLLD